MIIPRAPKELTLRIDRYWNGARCADRRLHGSVALSSTPGGLRITATLPHQAVPHIPPQPPGTRVSNLWEYDAVECFIVGSRKYLEVELGAGGHFLVLDFHRRAPRVRDHDYPRFRPALTWLTAAPGDPARWRSSVVIPWEMVPKRPAALNAFVVTPGHLLAYRPTGGSGPDFHRPGTFPRIRLAGATGGRGLSPRSVLRRFALPAAAGVTRFGTGLINRTYHVRAKDRQFVLQKLHEIVSGDAIDDMHLVTEHLAESGLRVPRLVRAMDGEVVVRDGAGGRWRLYPLIAGRVFDAVRSPEMAEEAGRIVGEMHRLLRGLSAEPTGSIEHFHDTAHVLQTLRAVAPKLPKELRPLAAEILTAAPGIIVTEETAGEARQIIHGDLKISNILFDDAGRAVGIIDFDTILRHFRAIDVGDMLRSWCNRTAEDDRRATFDAGIFEAALAGYARGWGAPVREDERRMFLRATRQITYELASRFLVDVVCDHYFHFRKPHRSRRAANIARALGQYHLAKTIPAS